MIPRIKSEKAIEYISELGIRRFSDFELAKIAEEYTKDLFRGIQDKKKGSLQMIPTLISFKNKHLIPGKRVFVLEIGGTNIYAAQVVITKKGKAQIIRNEGKIEYHQSTLKRIKFSNIAELFKEIAKHSAIFFSQGLPDALAIIYSFPGKPIETNYGIDVVSDTLLPKDFPIRVNKDTLVGRTFLKLLHEMYGVSETLPLIVLNDTPAVLLAEDSASMGVVLGTGFNISLSIGSSIYNTESGSFSGIPINTVTDQIDKESKNPGKGMAEKQISGLYLGLTLEKTVDLLVKNNFLEKKYEKKYTAQDINSLMSKSTDAILKVVAERLITRSSQLVSTLIISIIKAFPGEFSRSNISIPVEGSVFWGLEGFNEMTKINIESLCPGKSVTFMKIQHAGIIGAAKAAIYMLKA